MNTYAPSVTRLILVLCMCFSLVSCGGGEKKAGQDLDARGNTTLLTAEGGQTKVDLGEDGTMLLTIPPGAVYQDLALTWDRVEPTEGELLAIQVSPAGLLLAKPITLELELPGSLLSPAMYFGSLNDPFFVDAQWDGTRLKAKIQVLGGIEENDNPSLIGQSKPGIRGRGESHGNPGSGSGILHVAELSCEIFRDNSQTALDLYVANKRFERARQVVGAYEAMARQAGCAEDLAAFVETHRELACNGFSEARNALAASDFAQPADFLELARPVGFWAGILATWAAQCVELDAGYAALQNAYERLVSLYNDRIDTLDGSEPDAFTDFKRLARDLIRLEEEVLFLGVPDYAQDLRNTIEILLQKLHDVAYRLSQENETSIYLVELTQPRFYERSRIVIGSDPEPAEWVGRPPYDYDTLQQSIHLAGTHVTFQSRDAEDATIDDETLTGGITGVPRNTEGSIYVPLGGELELSGWINPVECRLNDPLDDSIEFRVLDKVLLALRRDAAGAVLGEAASIPIDQALEELGLPVETGEEFTLSAIRVRSGGNCGDELVGPTETELFTLHVKVKDKPKTKVYLTFASVLFGAFGSGLDSNGVPNEQSEHYEQNYSLPPQSAAFDDKATAVYNSQFNGVSWDIFNSVRGLGTRERTDQGGVSSYQMSYQLEGQSRGTVSGAPSGVPVINARYPWMGSVHSNVQVVVDIRNGPAMFNLSASSTGGMITTVTMSKYGGGADLIASEGSVVTELLLEPGIYDMRIASGVYLNGESQSLSQSSGFCFHSCEGQGESCRACSDVLPVSWDTSGTLTVNASVRAVD